jgi:hypothetical protein
VLRILPICLLYAFFLVALQPVSIVRRVSKEASASRKVLQVLASVLLVWRTLANVCRLMLGNFYI